MKKKRGLIFLLIALMLSACGNINNAPIGDTETNVHMNSETTPALTATPVAPTAIPTPTQPITLKVYSQLCSWSGEQQGWFAKVLLDKFNVKLYYMTENNTQEPLEEAADLIIFGNTGDYYKECVEQGLLLDWEANDLLAEHGAYILENMPKALEHNRSLTPQVNKIFGFGQGAVPSADVCEDFFYTWDIRWDLYKELGYPQVQDLEELVSVFEDMKALCPTDENGEETYAMSLWPDWDQNMMLIAKCMATAYYGYDEHGLGLYDTKTGTFYGALEENGPYLEMLRFFNTLYRKDLLDPDSRTQTFEDMLNKLRCSGVFFSVFNYAGSMEYNTKEHMTQNKYMAGLLPEEASPAAYGLSVYGGIRPWTIGANTQYPELCMELINWLCTPEGRMTFEYGPQGMFWDYDEERNTYFTELGKTWMVERVVQVPEEYGGGYFNDGAFQLNNITWSSYAPNPDSNGECYNHQSWKSNTSAPCCPMEEDWREYIGALTANEYIKSKNYVVIPATHYEAAEKGENLEAVWEQVAERIVKGSWDAIYAESEEAFERIVSEMITEAKKLGYEECVAWCNYEAVRRHKLEEALWEE
ncbi:MAG: hypothetical protein IJX63_11235 [Lachnospiraceae bacterium]|nr:hypothetical protein [Lachnospiraceae bacterium]